MDRVKRIWYLLPMQAAKVQESLRIRAVSPEPPLLAYTSSESRGTFRQKARSLAPLNDWACAVKVCHDGMLEDTNSLDGAQLIFNHHTKFKNFQPRNHIYASQGYIDHHIPLRLCKMCSRSNPSFAKENTCDESIIVYKIEKNFIEDIQN